MSNVLEEFLRCPEELVAMSSPEQTDSLPGYFRFGRGAICYGQAVVSSPSVINNRRDLPDLARYAELDGATVRLPFDVRQVIDNLRLERYPSKGHGVRSLLSSEAARRLYYCGRPMLGNSARRRLQQLFFRDRHSLSFPDWPVDTSVEHILERILLLSIEARNLDRIPFIWFWPDGASSAGMVTHDVETRAGLNFVSRLMDLDEEFDIKASYQLVPEQRYPITGDLLAAIRERGCEVNVHGLNHDGNLFGDRETFLRQATLINEYVRNFCAVGFRSPCMYRNVDWYQDLAISYDMSMPNVAHLEPQRGGCCTVFPYFIGRILEIPLTTVQDYSLLRILEEDSIDLWKEQIELIRGRHGLISFIVHPDYILDKRSLSIYEGLLAHLFNLRSEKGIWFALPGDINRWWRDRSEMRLVLEEGRWRIVGRGRERARIGFASIKDDRIVYAVAGGPEASADRDCDLLEPSLL